MSSNRTRFNRLMTLFQLITLFLAGGVAVGVSSRAVAEERQAGSGEAGEGEPRPRVLDEAIQIKPFAAAPQIVTPTGIAVDDQGRVLVIESHTHFPKADYVGPKTDRIKWMEDTDGDGRADRIVNFYEGGVATMNLAIHPNGYVYVATRDELFRLRDTDDDGRADQRETLAKLVTKGTYPHNGLSGFAFDERGGVFFGMGENLGEDYELVGADKRTLAGGGEGGGVYRIDANGFHLRRVATGFWNPFHLCFDAFGRLFVVDNDPDSRPPCRLLHIVPQGDYGYRFRNGRKGTHPFTSWFGDAPGTLPLTAETGEAPSGVIAYESDNLPDEYRGALLATSWGNHAIQRYRLKARGASFQSAAETIIKGDKNFRPVGIALAPDGSLLVSDWVDRSYNVHGRGRIWRISRRGSKAGLTRRPQEKQGRSGVDSLHRPERERAIRELANSQSGREQLAKIARTHGNDRVRAAALATLAARRAVPTDVAAAALADASLAVRATAVRKLPGRLLEPLELARRSKSPSIQAAALRRVRQGETSLLRPFLGDDDPFVRQAARNALRRCVDDEQLKLLAADPSSHVRLAAALLMSRAEEDRPFRDAAPRLLADSDARVRFVAVQWVGESRMRQYEADLMKGLEQSNTSGLLFDAYAAALHLLEDGAKAADFEGRQSSVAVKLLDRKGLSQVFQARALRRIPPDHSWWTKTRFETFLDNSDPVVRIEVVRTLRETGAKETGAKETGAKETGAKELQSRLLKIVTTDADGRVRREALLGLDPDDESSRATLVAQARRGDVVWKHDALLTMQNATLTDQQRAALQPLTKNGRLAQATARVLDPGWRAAGRPQQEDRDGWRDWLEGERGEAVAGERLFFAPRGPRCYVCHRVDGRGGDVGPDLSTIGATAREHLLRSIVAPAEEVAPQFTPWLVQMEDGKVFTGVLVTERGDDQVYADEKGERRTVRRPAIEMRSPQASSIMPAGLVHRLTDQELRDLIAFLVSRRR